MTTTEGLVLTRDAIARGRRNDLYRAHASGTLTRVRYGVYAGTAILSEAESEERYRLRVRAAMAVRRNPVATSVSAVALLGLPLIGPQPDAVYLLSPGNSGRRRNGVVEIARRGTEEFDTVDGHDITGTAWSIIHACRHVSFAAALAIVENAIHVDRFNRVAPLLTPDELWRSYRDQLPFPRSARVRAVLEYASTLADTPLETISRVTIDELGFPEPLQQHELWLPRFQRRAILDFAWPQYRVAGEADGWGKYVDPRYSSLAPVERLKREKRRDNAIRELRWTTAHWEWADALQPDRLRGILTGAGLPRTRRAHVIR